MPVIRRVGSGGDGTGPVSASRSCYFVRSFFRKPAAALAVCVLVSSSAGDVGPLCQLSALAPPVATGIGVSRGETAAAGYAVLSSGELACAFAGGRAVLGLPAGLAVSLDGGYELETGNEVLGASIIFAPADTGFPLDLGIEGGWRVHDLSGDSAVVDITCIAGFSPPRPGWLTLYCAISDSIHAGRFEPERATALGGDSPWNHTRNERVLRQGAICRLPADGLAAFFEVVCVDQVFLAFGVVSKF